MASCFTAPQGFPEQRLSGDNANASTRAGDSNRNDGYPLVATARLIEHGTDSPDQQDTDAKIMAHSGKSAKTLHPDFGFRHLAHVLLTCCLAGSSLSQHT